MTSYLQNRGHYTTDAVFREELMKNPHHCLRVLCHQLKMDPDPVDDILLPKEVGNETAARDNPEGDVAVLDDEDWELVKDVFYMIKMPIDLDTEHEKLINILSRRRRKLGLHGGSVRRGGVIKVPDPELLSKSGSD